MLLSTIGTWLATQGASLILGALAKLALDAFTSWQNDKTLREAGRLEAERDQAAEGARVQGELAQQATVVVSQDDAIARLERGQG